MKVFFKKPYFIFLLLLSVIVVSVWGYLWFGLHAYEAGLPKNLMSKLIDDIALSAEKGNCEDIIAEYNQSFATESYEDKGAVLAELVRGKTLKYNKTAGRKSETDLYYSIFADEEEIARATLSQNQKRKPLGLAVYEISDLTGTKELTILTPSDTTVSIKDVELNISHIQNAEVVPRELQTLFAYPENRIEIPKYNEYFVDGLFIMPDLAEVDVIFSDGTTAEAVFIQNDYIFAGKPMSETLISELTDWISSATKEYSYYMSDDLSWSGFKDYLVETSPIYDRLRTLEVGWYTLHDSTRFENMQTSNFFAFSDGLISLRMTYDYIVMRSTKATTYNTDLTYFLAIDADGKWRIAEMVVN